MMKTIINLFIFAMLVIAGCTQQNSLQKEEKKEISIPKAVLDDYRKAKSMGVSDGIKVCKKDSEAVFIAQITPRPIAVYKYYDKNGNSIGSQTILDSPPSVVPETKLNKNTSKPPPIDVSGYECKIIKDMEIENTTKEG